MDDDTSLLHRAMALTLTLAVAQTLRSHAESSVAYQLYPLASEAGDNLDVQYVLREKGDA